MSFQTYLIISAAAVVAFAILVPVVMIKVEKNSKVDLDSLLTDRDRELQRRLHIGGR